MGDYSWEIIAGRLQSGSGCAYDYEEEAAAGVAQKEVFFAFWAPPQVSSKSIQKHIKNIQKVIKKSSLSAPILTHIRKDTPSQTRAYPYGKHNKTQGF